MWKIRLIKVVLRIALVMATAVILTLLILSVFYHVSGLGKIVFNKTNYYHYFADFRMLLLSLGSIKIIYWYLVGLMTLESLLLLIFKKPIVVITDLPFFTGLEEAILEEALACFGWSPSSKDSREPKAAATKSYGVPKEDKK